MSTYLHLIPYQDENLRQPFAFDTIAETIIQQWPGSKRLDANTVKAVTPSGDVQLEFGSDHTSVSCRTTDIAAMAAAFGLLAAHLPNPSPWLLGTDNGFDVPLLVTAQTTAADIDAYLKDQTGGTPMNTIQAQYD